MKNKYLLENEIQRKKFLIDQLAKFIENVPNDEVDYEKLELDFLQNGYFGSIEIRNIIYYWGYTNLTILKKDLNQYKKQLEKLNLEYIKLLK